MSDPPESWAALADNLQQLYAASTPAAAATAPSTAPAPPQSDYDNKDEAFLAVTCTDTNNPRDPFRWPQVAAARDRRFGPFGSFWAYLSEPCATWPTRDRDRYTGPFTRRTSASILVVGTRFDPASPYQNALAVTRELPRSRLLTLDGGDTSPSARAAASPTTSTATSSPARYRHREPPAGRTSGRSDRASPSGLMFRNLDVFRHEDL